MVIKGQVQRIKQYKLVCHRAKNQLGVWLGFATEASDLLYMDINNDIIIFMVRVFVLLYKPLNGLHLKFLNIEHILTPSLKQFLG